MIKKIVRISFFVLFILCIIVFPSCKCNSKKSPPNVSDFVIDLSKPEVEIKSLIGQKKVNVYIYDNEIKGKKLDYNEFFYGNDSQYFSFEPSYISTLELGEHKYLVESAYGQDSFIIDIQDKEDPRFDFDKNQFAYYNVELGDKKLFPKAIREINSLQRFDVEYYLNNQNIEIEDTSTLSIGSYKYQAVLIRNGEKYNDTNNNFVIDFDIVEKDNIFSSIDCKKSLQLFKSINKENLIYFNENESRIEVNQINTLNNCGFIFYNSFIDLLIKNDKKISFEVYLDKEECTYSIAEFYNQSQDYRIIKQLCFNDDYTKIDISLSDFKEGSTIIFFTNQNCNLFFKKITIIDETKWNICGVDSSSTIKLNDDNKSYSFTNNNSDYLNYKIKDIKKAKSEGKKYISLTLNSNSIEMLWYKSEGGLSLSANMVKDKDVTILYKLDDVDTENNKTFQIKQEGNSVIQIKKMEFVNPNENLWINVANLSDCIVNNDGTTNIYVNDYWKVTKIDENYFRAKINEGYTKVKYKIESSNKDTIIIVEKKMEGYTEADKLQPSPMPGWSIITPENNEFTLDLFEQENGIEKLNNIQLVTADYTKTTLTITIEFI